MTIKNISDNIIAAAHSYSTDAACNVVDDLRCCAPELAEVAIRLAMQQSPAAEEWIREKFLDVLFPFSAKARAV
jgi:hypothetical protein